MDQKKLYKLYDAYDGLLVGIGYANNLKELKKVAKNYCEECDYECYLVYAKLNKIVNKYSLKTLTDVVL